MARKPNDNDEYFDELEDFSENIFPPEWYDEVTNAINFTISVLEQNGPIKNRESIVKRIIDYNIEKTMNEHISMIPLPKVYNWSNSDVIEIFEEFAYLLNLIKNRPNFKEHTITIKFGKNKRGIDHFNFWRTMSLDEIKNLELIIEDEDKSTLKCIIRKVDKDK